MKFKIYAAIILLFTSGLFTTANAQTEINITAGSKTYSETFDSLSTGLIQNRIPYGILYDRVYGWSGLDNFQNSDTISVSRLLQGWYDIEQSYINIAVRPNRFENMRKKIQRKIFSI